MSALWSPTATSAHHGNPDLVGYHSVGPRLHKEAFMVPKTSRDLTSLYLDKFKQESFLKVKMASEKKGHYKYMNPIRRMN